MILLPLDIGKTFFVVVRLRSFSSFRLMAHMPADHLAIRKRIVRNPLSQEFLDSFLIFKAVDCAGPTVILFLEN